MSLKIALFATCIVDTLRPEIGFASLALLEAAGCEVSVPKQACCGQANFNNGDDKGARALAEQWLNQFEGFDYVVIPSGSCAAMLKRHAAGLFEDEPELQMKMQTLTERCYELSEFLSSVVTPRFDDLPALRVCYHDSCSGLRELGIKKQPRALLANIHSLSLSELSNAEACCGFGGTFCVKHPEISCHLADDKIAAIENTQAEVLLGGDWGCLMHLQGRIEKTGKSIEVKHFSEILAQAIKQEAN
jgi:L-lactate dehydrogenase complex protein LldE